MEEWFVLDAFCILPLKTAWRSSIFFRHLSVISPSPTDYLGAQIDPDVWVAGQREEIADCNSVCITSGEEETMSLDADKLAVFCLLTQLM